MQARLRIQVMEMDDILLHAQQQCHRVLKNVAEHLSSWRYVIQCEKATLYTLNMLSLDMRRKVFVAEGWVPSDQVDLVRSTLVHAAIKSGSETRPILNVVETKATPPTFINTNKYTLGFQGLVNTYGIPRYREMNPGAFAIILFPFLFAIMFGDVGHGSLLVALAAYFIWNEKKMGKQKLDDIIGMAFGGRYVLLLNGLFAVYVGFIYNEVFSVPMGLFQSSYDLHLDDSNHTVATWDGGVYTFGVDPMWHRSANKMSFFNSLKMKISIVFGVAQMTLGITLSLFNHLEFKDHRSIWFGFLPEIVFFLCIFGYLCILIFLKWNTDWVALNEDAPSLLNTLIAMFMSPGVYTESSRLFPGQENVQLGLLGCALLAVPLLLFPKPVLIFFDNMKHAATEALHGSKALAAAEEGGDGKGEKPQEDEEDEHDFSEVVVHQVIHTIEFVLGSISNTASYLRLWALSLAHSQLSELFWEKVMKEQAFPAASLPAPFNGIIILVCFAIWVCLNLGVIMVMENLSSFLHALRLQWVEFQNKFYSGDGYKFTPFSYASIDADED